MPKAQSPPTDLNERRLRIELDTVMTLRDGQIHPRNGLRVYGLEETRSGRTTATDLLGGPLIAAEHTDTPSYAELLEAFARVLRSEDGTLSDEDLDEDVS